jgi:GxxExxY protein
MEHSDITEKIIACAYTVYSKLGFGFLERVYENSLMIEVRKAGLHAEQQCPVKIYYEGEIVGDYVADIIVENKIILELKAIDKILDIHEIQLKNYLKATGIEVGLLINFGKSVEIKRKFVNTMVK